MKKYVLLVVCGLLILLVYILGFLNRFGGLGMVVGLSFIGIGLIGGINKLDKSSRRYKKYF